MRLKFACATLFVAVSAMLVSCSSSTSGNAEKEEWVSKKKKDGYDGPLERGLLEILKTQDPKLERVPVERLWNALQRTEASRDFTARSNNINLIWEERGPIYDSVGPSNGNRRGATVQPPGTFTSGRIRAFLVDAADPSGNTVWAAGVSGGLWKTTNFLSVGVPNWQIVSDFFDNMAISSIAQDPTNSNIMYFSTGEATSNSDAVFGKGVWKTTDHGLTWNFLSATSSFTRSFKILCDPQGNIYLATRSYGLRRSVNGGATWTSISPSLSGVTNSSYCTDIEFAGNRLLASFGYTTSSSGGTIAVRYTNNPATVTSSTWSTPAGLITSANRIELAARGDTVYAAPTNNANNVVATYKSFDGGATWTKNNLVDYASPVNIANGQGWYDLALEINPLNGLEFMVGGLDAYRSIDGGLTVTRNTFWVTNPPYVHADHHLYKWMYSNGELRIIMATDGGLFLSQNNGLTYRDRNVGLAIKQFYSGAIHPTRTHYILGGTQDNGSHQIKNAGKTYSIEVTGGDGAFVYIDQKDPENQFTSYVYNQYRRSKNDGNTFSSFNLSNNRGYFINPFDFDDDAKILYGSFAYSSSPNRSLLRWNNPLTATSTTNAQRDTLYIPKLAKGSSSSNVSSITVSPYTSNRIFVGGHNGSLVRIDGASTATEANIDARTTLLTGSFPNAFLNCIAVGKSDNELLAVFSNYGVNNLWYSANGGASWTTIDGNLPDMPVRWAVFHPIEENKIFIATETGVWATEMINGSSTHWTPSGNFPTVRTDMLKIRKSDNLMLAATHGRGMWTTNIATPLPVKHIVLNGSTLSNGHSLLKWKTFGETAATQYVIEFSETGDRFIAIGQQPAHIKTFNHPLANAQGYYRVKAIEPNVADVYSNVISLRNALATAMQVKIVPNPIVHSGNFILSSATTGNYQWQVTDAQGRNVLMGNGTINAVTKQTVPLNVSRLAKGIYRLKVMQGQTVVTQSFIRQ